MRIPKRQGDFLPIEACLARKIHEKGSRTLFPNPHPKNPPPNSTVHIHARKRGRAQRDKERFARRKGFHKCRIVPRLPVTNIFADLCTAQSQIGEKPHAVIRRTPIPIVMQKKHVKTLRMWRLQALHETHTDLLESPIVLRPNDTTLLA